MLTYTGGRGGVGGDGGSGAEGSAVKPGPSDTSEKTKKNNNKKSGSRGVASVILHKDATGADTVKSLLALEYFQEELREAGFDVVGAPPPPPPLSQSSSPATKGDNTEQQRVNGKNPTVVNGDSGVGVAVAREGVAVEGWAKGAVTASSRVASTEGAPVMEAVAVEGAGAGTGLEVGEVAAVTAAAVAVPLVAAAAAGGGEVGAGAGEPNGEEGDQSRGAGGHHHHPSPAELRRCLEAARRRADDGTPGFFAALRSLGWSTEKFMFGNIKSRVEWRI